MEVSSVKFWTRLKLFFTFGNFKLFFDLIPTNFPESYYNVQRCSDFTSTLVAVKLKVINVKRRLRTAEQGKMQTEIRIGTADYRLQKYILCYNLYPKPESKLSPAFGISLLAIMHFLCGVKHVGMLLFFSDIWRPLYSLFLEHGCLLFFKFTLAKWCFARAGSYSEHYSKISACKEDICKKTIESLTPNIENRWTGSKNRKP